MGVSHWLIAIEPEVYRDLVPKIEGVGEADVAAIDGFFKNRGREPDESIAEELDWAVRQSRLGLYRNGLLEALLKEREWNLYKQLGVFSQVIEALPQLGAMKAFVKFDGFDIEVPESCRGDDNFIWGIWSSQVLRRFSPPIHKFERQMSVRSLAEDSSYSLLERMTGKARKREAAVQTWLQEDVWNCWQTIREAILVTMEKGQYLGFCMSV